MCAEQKQTMNEELVPLCDILSFFLINNKGIFHWKVFRKCYLLCWNFKLILWFWRYF